LVRRSLSAQSTREPLLTGQDLHQQLHARKQRRLIVFAIDTSDSMGDGPAVRMSAALGAIMALAKSAYLNRDQVCLITFRDRQAEVVVPPTDSVMRIRRLVNRLPVGGATPLAAGLKKALQIITQAQHRNPLVAPLLVLISDGEATVPLQAGSDPEHDALAMANQLQRSQVPALVIDTLPGHQQKRLMPQLADTLGTRCQHIQNLQASQVLQWIDKPTTISS